MRPAPSRQRIVLTAIGRERWHQRTDARPSKPKPPKPVSVEQRLRELREQRPAQQARDLRVAALRSIWRREHVAFAEFRPLAIGIHQSLREAYPGWSWRVVRLALARHVRHVRYQQAIAAGGSRYDLNGQPCGEVNAEHARSACSNLAARGPHFRVIGGDATAI